MHHTLHFAISCEKSDVVRLLVLQVQQMLRASEGVESYTDTTPLRLLPCDGACQKAKASTRSPLMLCSIIRFDLLACLFTLVAAEACIVACVGHNSTTAAQPGNALADPQQLAY